MEKGQVREWVSKHSEHEQQKLVEEMTFVSYPYEKYGEVVLAFEADNGWNVQICNLAGKEFTDGLYIGYKETLPFVEYLGKRIELAFNYFKGKSNEEIELLLKGGNVSEEVKKNG